MLFRQKYLCVLFVLMMFFVIASGGCGGSSSSNRHENDNSNPDNPTTEYDISVLLGEWAASNGTAAMTEGGENFNLIMEEEGGSFSFSNIQLNGNNASIDMEGETFWEYQNGSRLGTGHHQGYHKNIREFQHVSRNIWRMTFDEGSITITINSPTKVKFEHERSNMIAYGPEGEETSHHWTASFTLTKQDTF
ncbi:MAG: hypothetical protein IJR43_01750 [Synergistaceae bacterium]|nr:hypothetical protein [Synergistaceae bacterium]